MISHTTLVLTFSKTKLSLSFVQISHMILFVALWTSLVQRWNHHKKTTPKYASKKKYPYLLVDDISFYELYDTTGGAKHLPVIFTLVSFVEVGRNDKTVFYLGRIDESSMQGSANSKTTNPVQSSLLSTQSTQTTTTTTSTFTKTLTTEVKDQKETPLEMELKEQIVRESSEGSSLSNKNGKKKRHTKKSKKKKKNKNQHQQTNQNRDKVTVQCIRSICEWSGGTNQFPPFSFLIFLWPSFLLSNTRESSRGFDYECIFGSYSQLTVFHLHWKSVFGLVNCWRRCRKSNLPSHCILPSLSPSHSIPFLTDFKSIPFERLISREGWSDIVSYCQRRDIQSYYSAHTAWRSLWSCRAPCKLFTLFFFLSPLSHIHI